MAVNDTHSSVLFETEDKSIIILDIPRSLEESQVLPGQAPTRRIYSSPPATEPFETPEPKDGGFLAINMSPALQVADLMTAATVQNALQEVTDRYVYAGSYCLPRLISETTSPHISADTLPFIPENATYLHGSIEDLAHMCKDTVTKVDLIVLDPPWPNRSARRKTKDHNYKTVSNLTEMQTLLSHIPVPSLLKSNSLVGVWVTNNSNVIDFLTAPVHGLFATWGLELAAEWTWVKVTASGEPLYDLDSSWRKPWEKLMIAKRIGNPTPPLLKSKLIISVPDLHSRKPNLRGLFQDIFDEKCIGLEVFARNLTAGWWAWGDEVLRFQQAHHWKSYE